MKKLILLTTAIMLIAASSYAATGRRYVLVIPPAVATDDSTLAAITGTDQAIDLASLPNTAKGIRYWVGVTSTVAEMDSVDYLAQVSPDGTNWYTHQEDVNAVATVAGTGWSGAWTTDSTSYGGMRYYRVIAKVVGDGAGTSIRTIYFTSKVQVINGVGEAIQWLYGSPIECSFQE